MDYSQGAIGGPAPPPQQMQPQQHAAGAHNEFLSKERPEFPTWVAYLLIPILIFTLIVMGLTGYAVSDPYLKTGYDSLPFALFAASWGIIVTVYIFLAIGHMPHIHYKWIVFILAVLTCIWWLVAFAYLASQAREVMNYINTIDDYYNSYSSYGSGSSSDYSDIINDIIDSYFGKAKRDISRRKSSSSSSSYYSSALDEWNKYKTAGKCMAAAAGVGAIVWILWMIFTIFYSIALFRNVNFHSASGAVVAPPPVSYEPKTGIPLEQPAYPAVPVPVASPVPAYGPVKPDPAYDPRVQTPFITPPPPQPYQPMPVSGPPVSGTYSEMPVPK
ncbi:hypothetical protein ABW19_dt0202968 [Dactylella cylindrospora]|nr:hypothetical protein ABW19_dt0202968 [Dactylella cylindrospora]